jgi:glycosyltransferase involved in cell wall biosynthesis
MSLINSSITAFLSECEPYVDSVGSLKYEEAVELFGIFETMLDTATANINLINPQLRVDLRINQEKVLERIIDIMPDSNEGITAKKVYTPAVQGYRRWQNVELMKDKGLTGYKLAEQIGASPVMYFCTKPEDYSYLSVLDGLEMLYNDSEIGESEVYRKHLQDNYADMDVLILHGMYPTTSGYLNGYRQLRPDGKVYCGLDMHSGWMNRIIWNELLVQSIMKQCDIIATSCSSIRDALNGNPNVNFSCHFLSNAFFNPAGLKVIADADVKENTIITVGRIGTEQKNSTELILGFERANLQDWTLKLIGSIEPEFMAETEKYLSTRPELKERIIFTGSITDKTELYSEYSKAKIFALTSRLEGGTPNVYSEALAHGCMFVTSDIDAANDITNHEQLGMTYKLGDIDALAGALRKICSMADKKAFYKHIPLTEKHLNKHFNWERSAKKLKFLLFGGKN